MANDLVPEEIKERYNKASMAIDKQNYDYAVEILLQIINIVPDFAKGRQLLRLAEIKRFEKNPPNILVGAMNRISSFLFMFIAFINESKGDRTSAISVYEKTLKNDPKNTVVLVKLGALLKAEGMNEAAAVTLESAVNIRQKNAAAYELLGEIYSGLGSYDRARYCFKRVLEMKPHDANAESGLKNLDALTTIDESFKK